MSVPPPSGGGSKETSSRDEDTKKEDKEENFEDVCESESYGTIYIRICTLMPSSYLWYLHIMHATLCA